NLSILDTNVAIIPQAITLEDYLANPESFEGEYVKLLGVGKAPSSVAWPANTDANMTIWNGKQSITLRVDKDTDLDNNPEPVFPVNVFGVATQYTSAATVYLDGYQLTPNFYTDFEQNVAVPPSKYFYLKSPKNGDTLTITDSNQVVSIKWTKALDLNGDTVNYRVVLLTSPNQTGATITDTVWNTTGKQVLQWLGSKDTLLTKWTVKAKGKETALISSVDTFTILLIKKITNDVRIDYIPVAFYVEQNYPNPFNPSTSIKFGLNKEMKTDLRVYNILGQEVTVLIDNELLKAGTYIKTFQANKLASGAYFYRLRTDNNVVTKKMLLVR
ncbi:MAG: T9SS type A sorting domain-containing protein, partial [Ignavibacteriales bacterium]|nr:T9SS type A sorting domain-containing protein [Ignavibacteriales bacterium]